MNPFEGLPKGTCAKCKIRQATVWWTYEGTIYEARCSTCCVEEQLAHAREMAASTPGLEAKLATLSRARRMFGAAADSIETPESITDEVLANLKKETIEVIKQKIAKLNEEITTIDEETTIGILSVGVWDEGDHQ